MRIRAVVFDIGQTLVHYPIPLNWSALYRPVFEHIEQKLGLSLSEGAYEHIGKTLAKYNTRINPREKEVSSDLIFTEILEGTGIPGELKEAVKNEFYHYFRREARVYPEAEKVLAEKMGAPAREIAFVGDEIKDVQCAKNAGAVSVLINRTGETKDYGQDYEIKDLQEIIPLIG